MPLAYPRPIPAQIRAVLGDDDLVEVDVVDRTVSRLRPKRPGRAVLVLHCRPPEQRSLVHDLESMFWLGGRGGAPEVLASGRADEGDEMAVVRMPVGAVPAARPEEHGVDPATVATILGRAIRDVHQVTTPGARPAPTHDELRREAAQRVAQGLVTSRPDGPYRSRPPEGLLAALDTLIGELGTVGLTFTHGNPSLEHLWIAPDQEVWLTGWTRAGLGDRHRDLAVASRSLATELGPATVAPFLDAYGLDDIDLRRLDAHQLLDHLLT